GLAALAVIAAALAFAARWSGRVAAELARRADENAARAEAAEGRAEVAEATAHRAAALEQELAEARRSERRLTAFLDATTVGFWSMEAAAREHDEALELIHPDDRAAFLEGWREALAQPGLWEARYRMRRPDGSYAHMHSRNVPLLGDDGAVLEWV